MKKQYLTLLTIIILSITTNLQARPWQAVEIPGAKCGNGSPYKVWIHKKKSEKLAIEFMGGGACWSKQTCFGTKLRTWIFPIIRIPHISVFSSESPNLSPAHDASMIYFPYCTGDVHSGNHTANYEGHKIYHWGKRNVENAFKYLRKEHILEFDQVNELLVYGGSAGALGSLANTQELEKLVPITATKTMIADSPGLHFGNSFWNKFSDKMFNDLKQGFQHLVKIQKGDGFLAKNIPQICKKLKNWNIGFLQGSRDIVMSRIFGNISQNNHEKLVYGNNGVTMKDIKVENCSSFVVPGSWHTFLLAYPTAALLKVEGINAIDYLFEVAKGKVDVNYR